MTTTKEADYEIKELITPIRAYKVMGDGSPVVNHYYKMVANRAMIPSLIHDEKVGSVTVQYVSNTGEKLKSDEIVAGEVPYEISKTYDLISGRTKVGEEKVFEKLLTIYDTTSKRFDKIIADKTGFTYEFDAIAFDSELEIGVIDKAQTIVKYVYRLVSKEDPNPVKKEVKGSVIVKYVDAEGNEIKPAETLVNDVVLRTTYTYITKSGDKVVSTRDEVGDWHIPDYNAKEKWHEKIITADGKNYDYQGIHVVSDKFNNTTAETGKVAEGITTVVYQYDLAKPSWEVPADSPKEEVPEYEGGVASVEPPVLEVPEFKGGVASAEPPVLEIPEFKGGVSPVAPTILEVPEYRFSGSANRIELIPNPKYQLQDTPTVERLERNIVTLDSKKIKKSERLPNTGSNLTDFETLGFAMMLAGISLAIRRRQKEE